MATRLKFYFLKNSLYVLGLLFVLPSPATAQTEPPQFMTVDGRLYDSTIPTDPLLDNSVLMRIQILNPAKSCILYEEEQTISTLSSNGFFNVRVGSPTSGAESLKRTTATIDVGNSMRQIFQNQSVSIAGKTAAGVVCGYTPVAGDTRHFRYIVTPSTTGVISTLSPDMQIDSVPQSLVAESLQGLAPSDFVQITSDVTQAKMNGLFGPSYTTLTGLLAGSSSLYLQNTTNGTVIPSRATNPLTPAAGQIWYDNDDFVMRYYDGTSVLTLGISGGDPTKLPLAGGTMAGAIDMGNNDITNLGHVTQTTQRTFRFGVYTTLQQGSLISTPLVAGHEGTVWYNTTTNKLMFWDGATAFAVSPVDSVFGRTGAVVAATSDYDAVQIDNAPAGNIAATNTQAAMDELDSEKLAKAGDTMTGQLNMGPKGVVVGDGGAIAFTELAANGINTATIRAPDAMLANYVLTLPDTAGAGGQVLSTNGTGVLSWVNQSSIADDSLNFDKFSNTLVLDASTDIGVTGANVLSITNSGTGDSLRLNDQAADTSPFVINAAGNVGIGTTTPAAMLDVIGTIKGDYHFSGNGTQTNPGFTFTSDTDTGLFGSGSGDMTFTSNGNDRFFFDATSLGSLTSRSFHLAHSTNTAANPPYGFRSDTDTGMFNAAAGVLAFSTDGSEKLRIDSVGNVGIGTTVPGTILDAAGAITSRPNGTGTGQTGQLIMRELAVGGTETATIRAPDSITTSYALTLPDTAGTSGQVLRTNGAGLLSWVNSDASISADSLDFTHLADALTLDASTDIAATGTNVLSITNSGTGNTLLVNDAAGDTSPFVIDASGNVGIGTTTAGSRLEVRSSAVSTNPINVFSSTGFALFNVSETASSNGTLELRDSTGTATVRLHSNGTSVLLGGNVGVGLSDAGTQLEVKNVLRIRSTSGSNASITNTMDGLDLVSGSLNTTTALYGTGVKFMSKDTDFVTETPKLLAGIFPRATETYNLDTKGGMAIDFSTAPNNVGATSIPTVRMSIDHDGEVGIGTTAPGTILDVAGAITSRPFGAATGQTGQLILRELAATGTETATIRAPDAITASYALTLPDTAGSSGQVLRTNGTGLLSWVNSDASITADSLDFTHFADAMTLDASTDIAATGTNVLSITNSGTGNSFLINDQAADTTPFVIDAAGNVGVGTTAPGSNTRLDVNGQIRTPATSIADGSVDFAGGNTVITSFDCGTNITLANIRRGGSYTVVVTGTGTTQCSFSTAATGDDAATVSYRFQPANGVRTATSHTVYSLLRVGDIVYVSWITGFI